MTQSIHGFDGDRAHRDEQEARIGNCSEYGEAAESIGAPSGGAAPGEHRARPRQDESEDVAKVVPCVGGERQRMGANAEYHFGEYKRQIQANADRECTIKVGWRVMVMMTMIMRVAVWRVCVARHEAIVVRPVRCGF